MGVLTHRPGLPLWSDYTRFARRHQARLAVLTGLGMLAGLAWSLMQPATYSATASVVLAPVPVYVTSSTAELVAPPVSIDTDAQLLRSPEVLGAVGDVLGRDPEIVSENLLVTASPSTSVLHVTVSAGSPAAAADAANAAIDRFVDVRREALGALRRSQLRQLRLLLSEHEDLLAREQGRRLVIPFRDELYAQLVSLRTSLEELEAARRLPAEVVRPAEAPKNADYANAEVPITSGAMLGLVAGCLLGAGRDRARRLGDGPEAPRTQRFPSGREPGVATRHEEYDHAI